MVGFSIGLVLGPPIGGALYERFGFRGPFVFGIIFSVADLIGRFVIIERAESIKWGVDPLVPNPPGGDAEKGAPPAEENAEEPKPLSFIAVMGKLIRSPRAVAAFLLTLLYGRVNLMLLSLSPTKQPTVSFTVAKSRRSPSTYRRSGISLQRKSASSLSPPSCQLFSVSSLSLAKTCANPCLSWAFDRVDSRPMGHGMDYTSVPRSRCTLVCRNEYRV